MFLLQVEMKTLNSEDIDEDYEDMESLEDLVHLDSVMADDSGVEKRGIGSFLQNIFKRTLCKPCKFCKIIRFSRRVCKVCDKYCN